MERLEKVKLVIATLLRILLLGAIILAIANRNWINLALSVFSLFLTFLPNIISHRFKVGFPIEFEIAIIMFIYASLYLGEVRSFYEKFWWWDIFLHTFSAMIMGGIGFSLVYILNKEIHVSLKMSPAFVGLFSFSFALSIGAVWEIFEFGMDRVFHTNMQKSGLVDTMTDLMVDTIGALITSYLGYLYMKGRSKVFKRIAEDTIKRNPRLFEKEKVD
jgi:hypothetical protein